MHSAFRKIFSAILIFQFILTSRSECKGKNSGTLSGDATYYDVSVGYTACGTRHNNTELIAAVAPNWWSTPNPNNDPICDKTATVTNPKNGQSVTVRIKDKCPGCKREDIDLSPSAFQALEKLEVGRFKVNWVIH